MQNVADGHDTDMSGPPGVACNAQAVPFHFSAPAPAPLALDPTASQKLAEVHDTPLRLMRWPPPADAGFAVCWILHLDPFHLSARAIVVRPR